MVCGPVLLAGLALAAYALVSTLVAGWIPGDLLSGNAADWIVGAGARGDAGNFFRFMVGALFTAGAWTAIRWGFHGSKAQ